MAQSPTQIFPNDLIAHRAIGVKLPLSSNSVFGSTYTNKDAIKYNLVNYLLTNPGELPGNPTFGAGLRQFIFEQISSDTLDGVEGLIQEGVRDNVPNIEIENITILSDPDRNNITVQLNYNIPYTGVSDQLELAFN